VCTGADAVMADERERGRERVVGKLKDDSGLSLLKNQNFFKILHHIEFCGTMEY
jgi:hypothetical protein